MDTKGKPPEGATTGTTAVNARRPPLTPPPYEEGKRRGKRKTAENVLAAGAAALGIAHVLAEKPKESKAKGKVVGGAEKPSAERPSHPEWKRNAVGEIVSETVFHDEHTTGGIQNEWVSTFKTIFEAPEGTFFYIDTKGNILRTTEETEPIKRLRLAIRALEKQSREKGADRDALQAQILILKEQRKQLIQPWHNANRSPLAKDAVTPSDYNAWGYPFVATPTIPGSYDGSETKSLIGIVAERLQEKVASGATKPEYFHGEERSLYDAIVEIAKAYDLPRAIVLGIGANESGYDRYAVSKADAKGIFQLKQDAFDDAKKYLASHPEPGASLRSGPITGTFSDATCGNRLVSAELCCAYFCQARDWIRKDVARLEERLAEVDPSFPTGTLLNVASINAYNAGPGTIKTVIQRFVSLSDAEIKRHLDNPEYGIDAWLGTIGLSYGIADEKGRIAVGPDVFMYPQKILAMGSLIMDEENALSAVDRTRDEDLFSLPPLPEVPALPTRRSFWDTIVNATGIGAVVGGLLTGADTARDVRTRDEKKMGRRDFLKAGASAVAVTSPALRAGREWMEGETPEIIPEVETVEGAAKRTIDALNAELLRNGGGYEWTADEQSYVYRFGAPKNRELLNDHLRDMLGADLMRKIDKASGKERERLFAEVLPRQKEYVAREIAAGNLVPIPTGPDSQVFCEQVGMGEGLENDPEALYMRKEFLKIIPRLIELINYQIDAFNENPAIYGIRDETFPKLPHVSAMKISSALRYTGVTNALFKLGKGGNTSKSGITPHWIGAAVDFLSLTTPGGHVATFDGDLLGSKNGSVILPKGQRLPNVGNGARVRDILSKMAGRALFAMREPMLRLEGIELQPLREERSESSSKLWHTVVKTVETKP